MVPLMDAPWLAGDNKRNKLQADNCPQTTIYMQPFYGPPDNEMLTQKRVIISPAKFVLTFYLFSPFHYQWTAACFDSLFLEN